MSFRCWTEQFDILKIDIEGGEYGLLGDERFGSVQARTVVLEMAQNSRLSRRPGVVPEQAPKIRIPNHNRDRGLAIGGPDLGFQGRLVA